MKCEPCRELMLDVLYGEQTESRTCFSFFEHVQRCEACRREYLELIETRELLLTWPVETRDAEDSAPVEAAGSAKVSAFRAPSGTSFWSGLQKLAAGVLMLFGLVALLQYSGIYPISRVTVSPQELTEMVHDMIVAEQTEERRLIGSALVTLKEELDLQRRTELEQIYDYLTVLEQRYVENLEENNHYLRTLLSR